MQDQFPKFTHKTSQIVCVVNLGITISGSTETGLLLSVQIKWEEHFLSLNFSPASRQRYKKEKNMSIKMKLNICLLLLCCITW